MACDPQMDQPWSGRYSVMVAPPLEHGRRRRSTKWRLDTSGGSWRISAQQLNHGDPSHICSVQSHPTAFEIEFGWQPPVDITQQWWIWWTHAFEKSSIWSFSEKWFLRNQRYIIRENHFWCFNCFEDNEKDVDKVKAKVTKKRNWGLWPKKRLERSYCKQNKRHFTMVNKCEDIGKCYFQWCRWGYVYVDHKHFKNGGRSVIEAHFNGLLNLIELLPRERLKRFIQIGSSDEYGNAKAPQHEDLRENPMNLSTFLF